MVIISPAAQKNWVRQLTSMKFRKKWTGWVIRIKTRRVSLCCLETTPTHWFLPRQGQKHLLSSSASVMRSPKKDPGKRKRSICSNLPLIISKFIPVLRCSSSSYALPEEVGLRRGSSQRKFTVSPRLQSRVAFLETSMSPERSNEAQKSGVKRH